MAGHGNFIINNGKLIQYTGGAMDVVVPDGVVTIGDGAFHGYDVETVYIPDGVVEIGNNCFNNCKKLKSVRIPASVQKISDTAFRDTKGVKIVTREGTYAWNYSQNRHKSSAGNNAENQSSGGSGKAIYIDSAKAVKQTGLIVKSVPCRTENSGKQISVSFKTNDCLESTVFNDKTVAEKKIDKVHEKSLAEQMPEKRKQDIPAVEKKEVEYARLLGCKVGEQPWKMRNNFLGRADKLAQRIKNISEQELLVRIVREAKLPVIRSAALKNITMQDILIEFATDTSVEIRLAAICNLQDQQTLRNLTVNDSDGRVREAAVRKVEDSKIVKKYLMKIDRSVSDADFKEISDIKDIQDLAISAYHRTVREIATGLLPNNTPEKALLKAAVEMSKEITPYAVDRFKNAAEQLRQKNPEFLDVIAKKYPFPGVRYLAREKNSITPKNTDNMEALLASKTPSQIELEQQEKIKKCEQLLYNARDFSEEFVRKCHSAADRGEKYCKLSLANYMNNAENYNDADVLKRILLNELHKKGFSEVSVEYNAIYDTYREEQRLNGFKFEIYTHW